MPPPDDEEVDHATIDAVLADFGWERREPSGAEILVVGDAQTGRAIAYRQSQFVYESVVRPTNRNTMGTFSTAAAARRFMIMAQLAAPLAYQLPKIQPTGSLQGAPSRRTYDFELAWPGGEGHLSDRLHRSSTRS